MAVLFGDQLAARAWTVAKTEDASRLGMTVEDLESAIRRHGDSIRGDSPATVLRSALNRNQHQWTNHGDGIWLWVEHPVDPTIGLSGLELADAAWVAARAIDPAQRGAHYERIAAELRRGGTRIRGPQEGGTLTAALAKSPRFRKATRDEGVWTWAD